MFFATGNVGAFDFMGTYYSIVLSTFGLVVVALVSIAGFILGPDRLAEVFSFFWGTHEVWTRIVASIEEWDEQHPNARYVVAVAAVAIICLTAPLWIKP